MRLNSICLTQRKIKIMKRDAIDFKHKKVSVLFRRLLLPTLLGTLAMPVAELLTTLLILASLLPSRQSASSN